jgi:very-short-patch-repair endonuclease
MSLQNARRPRKQATEAEQRLWFLLRRKQLDGYRFRRQVPIGTYVADFACFAERLIVEVDGSQHADREKKDAQRTAWLQERGYRVIRVWNNDITENPEGVVTAILAALRD